MQLAHSCESHGAAGCEIYPFDLLKTDQIDSLAQKVLGNQQIDVLVNNAGIMVAGSAHQGRLLSSAWGTAHGYCYLPCLWQQLYAIAVLLQQSRCALHVGDMKDWENCLKLNVLAPMALTHAFAPGMVERKVHIPYTTHCLLSMSA